jgi:two-component system response regulator AtoC
MSNLEIPANSLQDVKIFVVDDEEILAWSIETELKALGAEVLRAASIRQALERFPTFAADLAICDLRLPDGNGMELLQKWRRTAPNMPVILVTAHGAVDSAITALRLGAFDYLQKPFDMKDLIAAVKRAAEISSLRQKVSRLQGQEVDHFEIDIVGQSPVMMRVKEQIRQIAQSKANTALILGESGTGKELAARAIHGWGDRKNLPFVEINCASIPENLLESELFGFEKGAFTDARERKLGLFEIARNGTIFLDEIGELPLKLQSKLLRALEYRRFKRLGGTKDIEFAARIVAATNRSMAAEVRAKRFRADLYYRLNVLPINLPSLREHKADIPALAVNLLSRLSAELDLVCPKLHESALEALNEHSWPGNVRELSNVLQRALVFHQPRELRAEHLSIEDWESMDFDMHEEQPETERGGASSHPDGISAPRTIGKTSTSNDGFRLPDSGINLDLLEKNLLEQALERAKNNQTRAARLLGISRHTLRYRLEKHGLVQV